MALARSLSGNVKIWEQVQSWRLFVGRYPKSWRSIRTPSRNSDDSILSSGTKISFISFLLLGECPPSIIKIIDSSDLVITRVHAIEERDDMLNDEVRGCADTKLSTIERHQGETMDGIGLQSLHHHLEMPEWEDNNYEEEELFHNSLLQGRSGFKPMRECGQEGTNIYSSCRSWKRQRSHYWLGSRGCMGQQIRRVGPCRPITWWDGNLRGRGWSTGWSLRDMSKTFAYWMSCNTIYEPRRVAKFLWGLDILLFDFWNNQKIIFFKIEVSGKIAPFLHLGENIINLIFRHFIVESSYYTGWRKMQQREKLYLKKFRKSNEL